MTSEKDLNLEELKNILKTRLSARIEEAQRLDALNLKDHEALKSLPKFLETLGKRQKLAVGLAKVYGQSWEEAAVADDEKLKDLEYLLRNLPDEVLQPLCNVYETPSKKAVKSFEKALSSRIFEFLEKDPKIREALETHGPVSMTIVNVEPEWVFYEALSKTGSIVFYLSHPAPDGGGVYAPVRGSELLSKIF